MQDKLKNSNKTELMSPPIYEYIKNKMVNIIYWIITKL